MSQYNFPPTSRYHGVEIATRTDADGRVQAYLRRRLLPAPDSFALLHEHVVSDQERPDTIAHAELGDAEAWWRLADANGVMQPAELTATVGRRLRITLPAGFPATPSAQQG